MMMIMTTTWNNVLQEAYIRTKWSSLRQEACELLMDSNAWYYHLPSPD